MGSTDVTFQVDADANGTYSATLPLMAPGNHGIQICWSRCHERRRWRQILIATVNMLCTVSESPFNNALDDGWTIVVLVWRRKRMFRCWRLPAIPMAVTTAERSGSAETLDLTFNVNTANISVGANGLYLGGERLQ